VTKLYRAHDSSGDPMKVIEYYLNQKQSTIP
jgi:hypothetical protein